jgi:surface antigen
VNTTISLPMRRRPIGLLLALLALVAGLLSFGVAQPAHATVGQNDYPSNLAGAAPDALVDPWGFYNRECTSFIAWRLNNDNHLAFSNGMGGGGSFGNASNWKARAQALGYAVDSSPKVGSVAWWSSGHVGYVRQLGTNQVLVEDYNWGFSYNYNPGHWVNNSDVQFIHFKDLPTGSGVRTAFVADQGALFRTDDTSSWQEITNAAGAPTAVSVSGQRMGIINSTGAAYRVNDNSPWVQIVGPEFHPKSIAVSDSGRMAFVADQGALFRTSDNAPWQEITSPAGAPLAVAVSGSRMGIINAGGAAYRVNDNSPWVQIVGPEFHPKAIAVSDSGRMAFIADQGALFRVSDTAVWQSLTPPSASPKSVAVSGDRMGLVNSSSGAIYRLNDNSSWIQVTDPSLHPLAIAVSG